MLRSEGEKEKGGSGDGYEEGTCVEAERGSGGAEGRARGAEDGGVRASGMER